ncbi:aldehyde ferredoxin oxidoreductase family protein [Chloroflexota bacterium]
MAGNRKMLDVDLSTGKIVKTDINPEFTRKYMGGMGFSNKILYDEVGSEVDPLSPENIVVFAPGTFSGSQIPGTCRTEITTRHPETGSIGTGNTGGAWGMHLKRAGYDVLVVRGKAEKPMYLWIDNDTVELREAGHLWGKDTYETTGMLEQETELAPRAGIIAIGQAGENLVPYACPITDLHHGANRTGAGAVMGAKKLKAIVVRGTGALRPVRPEEFKKAVAEMNERQEVNRKAAMMPGSYSGMGGGLRRYVEEGGLRVKNFQSGFLPDFLETRGNREINRKYDSGKKSCYACPSQCFQVSEVKEGKYAGTVIGRGTAIGIICAFGANCAIDNIPAILKSKELCQRFGMDYSGASGTIAYAMELFQRGIINESDTDGLDLSWGNEDSVTELLRKMAYREGFGGVLAEGCVKAAAVIGREAERFVMTTKGVEIIDGDPRAHQKIYTLCHITNPRGGDNIKGGHTAQDPDVYDPNWWIDDFDIFDDIKKKIFKTSPEEISSTWEGKALYCKWLQDLYTVQNNLGTDLFAGGRLAIGPTYLSRIFSAYTGLDTTPEELMESGERTFNLFKAYAARDGQSRKDDILPDRFFEEPLPDGPSKGAVLSRETIDEVLDEYYEVRGWDKETGIPARQKLIELGLDGVAEELSRLGKI